jgi:arylsulfatase A-like enzyme
MQRSIIIALFLYVAPDVDAQSARNGGTVDRPNIVFIMADDLGYGHLGCYGQKKIRTPRIDRMAREGTRFTQFYAGNCVCAPSRCVLMTGLHGGHTSVRVNGGTTSLRAEDITVAKVLSDGPGYSCGLFGKWGIGDVGSEGVPTRQGFDEFFGYLDQVHAHFYYPWYLLRGEEKQPLELYDLTTDVGEARNVASENPDIVAEIETYLRTATTPCRRYPPQEPRWAWERRRTGFVR